MCEREKGEGRETEHVHMHAHITVLKRQLGGSISSLLPCEASPQSKTDVKGGRMLKMLKGRGGRIGQSTEGLL